MPEMIGSGVYAPGEPIDHRELMELTGVEFDSDRITAKLGIRQRHIAHLRGIDETTADFAEKATRNALTAARKVDPEVSAERLDLFVVATDTPEFISPPTAVLLQGRLQGGQQESTAFDINASCAGFCTALDVAVRRLDSDNSIRYAVVVGVYNMPAYIRPGDAFGYSIFADGAGAVILRRQDGDATVSNYRAGHFVADGTQWNYVGVYSGGTRQPVTEARLASGEYGLQLLQRLPGDRNVALWPPVVQRLLEKGGHTLDEVDHFLFTQINKDVITRVMALLEQPMDKTTTIMDRWGYTGSACIPMALSEAVRTRRVRPGDLVVLVASGAGLAVAANLIRL